MRLQEEIEIPVSAKTTMANKDKKFGDKETIKLIKFLEQNPDNHCSSHPTELRVLS